MRTVMMIALLLGLVAAAGTGPAGPSGEIRGSNASNNCAKCG